MHVVIGRLRLCFLLMCSLLASVLAFPAGIRIADYRKLVSLSSVQISPDGARVAFVKSNSDFIQDRVVSSLGVVKVLDGRVKELTDGSRPVSSPRLVAGRQMDRLHFPRLKQDRPAIRDSEFRGKAA